MLYQTCEYILSGDTGNEAYRRYTFTKLLTTVPVQQSRMLATLGFYCTGYKDRIKCFRCGCWLLDDWVIRDCLEEAKWHRNDCIKRKTASTLKLPQFHVCSSFHERLPTPNETGQSPCLNEGTAREASVSTSSMNRSSLKMVELNNGDFLLGALLAETVIGDQDMTLFRTRVSSFRNSWSRSYIRASINDIAKAGLYYTGKEDKTKCFCCSGGLQNWEFNDDPWIKHASLYPECKYVISKKGIGFVRNVICVGVGQTESDAVPDVASQCSEPSGDYVFLVDPYHEISRLATFMCCKLPFTASMRHAAQDGVYYTGCNDIAKCFRCGNNWVVLESAYTPKLHASDCAMVTRTDDSNKPFMIHGLTELLRNFLYPGSITQQRSTSSDNNPLRGDEIREFQPPAL